MSKDSEGLSLATPDANLMNSEVSRNFRDQGRSEVTIQGILDVQKQLEKYLNTYLYSAEWIEEEIEVPETTIDPVSKKTTITTRKMKIHRYKPVPTEEKIIGCRMLGIKCNEKTFMPDPSESYAVDSDVFNGFCVIYVDNLNAANIENKNKRIERLRLHLKEKHNKTWDADDLKYTARWFTWNRMFNRRGLEKVKSYILLRVASVFSTSIVSEQKGKIGGISTEQKLLNNAVDAALVNILDIILHKREYGFNYSPTQVLELQTFEEDLFELALSRNLNGITLRGLLSAQEERKVTITNESMSSDSGAGIFKLGGK